MDRPGGLASPLVSPVSEIAAIILAAGLSSRFEGGPEETKLVVPLFGKPLVRHVAEAALASRACPILVVTGHALKNLDLSFIYNPTTAPASRAP
jgi:molybdenum cofactor cytidylyltransferase